MARRLAACLLAAAPLFGPATALAEDSRDVHGRCTDHVCSCVRHCPPSRKAAGGCHGADESPSAFLRAAGCRHGDDAVNPVATRPHVLPAVVAVHPLPRTVTAPPPPTADVLAGFFEIDLPPPRPRS